MRPAPCKETGFPKFDSASVAWKAGSKIIRHPEDTLLFIDHCDYCGKYHFRVKKRTEDQ